MLRVINGNGYVLDHPGVVVGTTATVVETSGIKIVSGDYEATAGKTDRNIMAADGTVTLPIAPDGTEKTITNIGGSVTVAAISASINDAPEYSLKVGESLSVIKSQTIWRIIMAYDPNVAETLASIEAPTESVNQTAHGLAIGDLVKYDGTDYSKAQADSLANAAVVGIVTAVADVDNFTVRKIPGAVAGLTGLTPGAMHYLDPDTAGAITDTVPSTFGDVILPVGVASSGTALQFRPGSADLIDEEYARGDLPVTAASKVLTAAEFKAHSTVTLSSLADGVTLPARSAITGGTYRITVFNKTGGNLASAIAKNGTPGTDTLNGAAGPVALANGASVTIVASEGDTGNYGLE
jgi:hypothetical protein